MAAATATTHGGGLSPGEIDQRDRLIKRVWNTDDLGTTLAEQFGSPLRFSVSDQQRRRPSILESQALYLGTTRSGDVLARSGMLCPAIHATEPLQVATVRSVVVWNRLPYKARLALQNDDELPLGAALRRYGVRRHTDEAVPLDIVDDHGKQQLLRVRARLTLPGTRPVAIVDEIVYLELLRRPRRPADTRRSETPVAAL
ncbi:hypothetical protein [Lentzea sp. NPDC092896]|uniref:hypothetical protein n=1 Tax=Lentzea sp. NPDC092896 TaxID=3364127 RepID=UPI003802EBEE